MGYECQRRLIFRIGEMVIIDMSFKDCLALQAKKGYVVQTIFSGERSQALTIEVRPD